MTAALGIRHTNCCEVCRAKFVTRRADQAFCSTECRMLARQKPMMEKRPAMMKRWCLKCKHAFTSWGIGNRMCGQCRRNPDAELA